LFHRKRHRIEIIIYFEDFYILVWKILDVTAIERTRFNLYLTGGSSNALSLKFWALSHPMSNDWTKKDPMKFSVSGA
jgi:hypothetical protein